MPLIYFTEDDWEFVHETLQLDCTSVGITSPLRQRLQGILGRILVIEPYEVIEETLKEEPPR